MGIFDETVERKNTDSLKYDFAAQYGMAEDVLPLWVADMDFRAPEAVLSALHERVEHGIFGYTEVKEDYADIVADWQEKRFGWRPRREWLVKTPGVVFGLNHVVRALTEPGDAVLIQQPVYYPFASLVRDNGRQLVNNELLWDGKRYRIDFEDFERKIADNGVKLFLLCSPHNPVGRVWTKEELARMGEICLRYNVFVASDEIHSDFTYGGHPHTVFAAVSEKLAQRSVICTSPSKTFNLAGLQISNLFIPDQELREKVKRQLHITGYEECNIFGLTACRAAYRHGEAWLKELTAYLRGNVDYVGVFLKEQIPQIRVVEPEGTYLLWLDCSGLSLEEKALSEFMAKKAKLWLDAGSMFGEKSGQFMRMNLTCPRSVLKTAMERLREAVREYLA